MEGRDILGVCNTYIGEGHGSPLQYSCPENSTDRGAWRVAVHEVAKSQTQLKKQEQHIYISSVQLSSVAQSCPTL